MPRRFRSTIVGDREGDATSVRRPYLLELNLSYPGNLADVTHAFFATWIAFRTPPQAPAEPAGAAAPPAPVLAPPQLPPTSGVPEGLRYVTTRIYQALLSTEELRELIQQDQAAPTHTIFKAWPDYKLTAHIDRSAVTVKCDAARRTYAASGRGVVWAVIDSGIDATHPHFSQLGVATDQAAGATPSPVAGLHRDFTALVQVQPGPGGPDAGGADPPEQPLVDEDGHGTHVAGIIAGRCPEGRTPHVASSDEPVGTEPFVSRVPSSDLEGMAPACELVSLKVLRLQGGVLVTSSAAVLRALDYIRTEVNTDRHLLRIHGVNLSLGCEWDPQHYAAGQSPLCQAIDELVEDGVVVVVSAGNGGQGQGEDPDDTVALMGTITEPAHAEGCIAVGSTHRDAPHRFGVTYTSGKGPTLDGRSKPDLVAPGEWITSAATGRTRHRNGLDRLPADAVDPDLTYAPDSGTSMAAPHVSGAIATFLSVRTEYIGRPADVKSLLLANATDLGRERYAQGAGLVDVMRMFSQS